MERVPTASSTAGPFLHIGLTEKHSKTRIVPSDAEGERVALRVFVFDADGAPVNDAMIEVWQADGAGKYHQPDDRRTADPGADFFGFGRAATNDAGACEFETVKPGPVPGPGGALQAPHLNLAIFARGILWQLCTRIYFDGDSRNGEDPVLQLVPESRRKTLLALRDPSGPNHWRIELRLRGENETVFFDL